MTRLTFSALLFSLPLLFGLASAKICPRYPLQRMMEQSDLYYQRELFLLGMHTFTTTPEIMNIYSFYQIGGIHGLPFVTYNGAETGVEWKSLNGTWWGGHCWHFTNPWLHWHRFYVLQFEKGMRLGAKMNLKQILKSKSLTGAEKRQWRKAYNDLRIPRWDWFDPKISVNGLPSILLNETMLVTDPTNPKGAKIRLHNPLHSYKMQASPVDTAPINGYGETLRNSAPYNTGKGQYTYRYPYYGPNGELTSSSELFNSVFEGASPALDIEIRLAMQPDTWDCFALGPANRSPDVKRCNEWIPASNDIHSNIHALTGGFGLAGVAGTMAAAETTGFDPIFFLHHANVDFIFSVYRAFKPDVALTPGQNMDGEFLVEPTMDSDGVGLWTEMPPFYKPPSHKKFYIAADADNYYKYDYSYIEIMESAKAVGLPQGKLPTSSRNEQKVAAFQADLDARLFAQYSMKFIYAGYGQAVAFVMDTMSFMGADWTVSVEYNTATANVSCGSMSSFNSLGNSMGAGFVERHPSVQLTQCMSSTGAITATNPPPKVPSNPGAGPACRPVPVELDPYGPTAASPFTITVSLTSTLTNGTKSTTYLTKAQIATVMLKASTYWSYEKSFINLPSGLNTDLPAC